MLVEHTRPANVSVLHEAELRHSLRMALTSSFFHI